MSPAEACCPHGSPHSTALARTSEENDVACSAVAAHNVEERMIARICDGKPPPLTSQVDQNGADIVVDPVPGYFRTLGHRAWIHRHFGYFHLRKIRQNMPVVAVCDKHAFSCTNLLSFISSLISSAFTGIVCGSADIATTVDSKGLVRGGGRTEYRDL